MAIVLSTSRLVLDAFTEHDAPAVHRACQDPAIQAALPVPVPFRYEDALFMVGAYARHGEASGQYDLWAMRPLRSGDDDGAAIGSIELRLDETQASASFGCWVAAPWRGHGYAREALQAVIDYAFAATGRDLTQLRWSGVVGNEASRALARRLHFVTVAAVEPMPFRGDKRPAWTALRRRADADEAPGHDGVHSGAGP